MNNRKSFLFVLLTLLTVNHITCSKDLAFKGYTISGPYTHRNLSVFLVHGKDQIQAGNILTLDEAIAQKKIIIHETQNVNELSVENISDEPVFIQSGEIVKGGKQDRALADDMFIQASSGKIPINSFCVEQGRWSQRGNEDLGAFNSSSKNLASKDLKLAARMKESQSEVWAQVATVQEKLSGKMGKSVKSDQSYSSLQLTLEDKDVEKSAGEYVNALSDVAKGQGDVIGFAFAINGEINSADIYGHKKLFNKLWPKMLEATAVEALTEYNKDAAPKTVTTQDVINWLQQTDNGEEKQKTPDDRTVIKVRESAENISFDTYDKTDGEKMIHKNMIKK